MQKFSLFIHHLALTHAEPYLPLNIYWVVVSSRELNAVTFAILDPTIHHCYLVVECKAVLVRVLQSSLIYSSSSGSGNTHFDEGSMFRGC
jgi:hypothetical protein